MQFRADDQQMSGRVLFFGQFVSMVEGQNLLNKFLFVSQSGMCVVDELVKIKLNLTMWHTNNLCEAI